MGILPLLQFITKKNCSWHTGSSGCVPIAMQCHPLLSSHLLVYLCCSTADCQSLRLSLLQDAASAVQDLVPVHAQVDAWRCALERFWEETGSGKPCEF